jgi:voltage-gated potassium channel
VIHKIRKHHKFMWGYVRALLRGLTRPSMVFLLCVAPIIILIASLIFYYVEGQTNPLFHSYFDALYFTVTVMTTVGLGDLHPVTTGGKIAAMGMMLAGTLIFIMFTAVFASVILEHEKRQYKD